MKTPGSDHPITAGPHTGRVTVRFGGTVVADTRAALSLKEASYPAVFYVPRSDAKMEHFKRTAHKTHCPYKGDASYFALEAGGKRAENAVWSYEEPYPAMETIRGYLAFYPNMVSFELTE